MATKAELFRSQMERSGEKRAPTLKRVRTRDPLHTMTLHFTKRGERQVSAALEDSESGRPSRKSTRGAAHHGRTDTKLAKAARDRSLGSRAVAERAKVARH